MMDRVRNVLVAERGATRARNQSELELFIEQRPNETAREFSQRVAAELSKLKASGTSFPRASLRLSSKRGSAADARRCSLARVLLSSLADSDELSIGGPLADSDAGRLDIDALAETLRLVGSRATVLAAHHSKEGRRPSALFRPHAA